ncbi:MAG TPA: hypothetical protein VG937_33315 [Polyangiaceae bacterium]|nr:hypothetical protein [Polyangiaceae bacterium]
MRFRARWIPSLLGLSLTCAAPASWAAPATPRVVEGSGESAGGLFTAGPNGARFALPSGALLRVSPGTALRVFPRPQALSLGPGGKTQTWSLALSHGRVDVEVPPNTRSAVLVSIARVAAVVSSGNVVVFAEPSSVTVVNTDGAAKTFIDNRWSTVEPGHQLEVTADHPAGLDSKLLESPAFDRGDRVWFTGVEQVKLSGFHWRPVAGATRFDVELRDGQKLIAHASLSEPKLGDALAPVGPGEYGLRIRSVDARGIEGPWSAPLPLRVVGVELPAGAYQEAGGIYLSGGQKLRFSHTRGLEMTYVGAGQYFPATDEVGLYRNQRTIVSLRYPNTAEIAYARLEPRDVYAQVFAGPKRATWPRDPIALTVRLRTRAGAPVPSFIEVVPKVQVGVEPLEVSWRREGSELHAVVPPRTGRGPWVIRVDVADQFGIPLGRDFVEVAAHATGHQD